MRSSELGILLAVGLGGTATFARAFPKLRAETTPKGIVDLELPRTTARAEEVVAAWEAQGLDGAAKRSILVDVPFVVSYTGALAAYAALVARAGDADATLLVIGALAAGASDLVENALMWRMLGGRTAQPVPALTTVAAALKFGLIAAVVLGAPVTALT
jgi:hypothetical protein